MTISRELVKTKPDKRFLAPPTWTSTPSTLQFEVWRVREAVAKLRVNWINLNLARPPQLSSGGKRLSRSRIRAVLASNRDDRLAFGGSLVQILDALMAGCWRPHDYSRCIAVLARFSYEDSGFAFSAFTLHRHWVFTQVLEAAQREALILLEQPFTAYCNKVCREEYQRYALDWYLLNGNDVQPDNWDVLTRGMEWSEDYFSKQSAIKQANVVAFAGVRPAYDPKRRLGADSYAAGALIPVDAGSADALVARVYANSTHGPRRELKQAQQRAVALVRRVDVAERTWAHKAGAAIQLEADAETLLVAARDIVQRAHSLRIMKKVEGGA